MLHTRCNVNYIDGLSSNEGNKFVDIVSTNVEVLHQLGSKVTGCEQDEQTSLKRWRLMGIMCQQLLQVVYVWF